MTRERRRDLAGIGIITILTLMGFYFSVFTQSSFTGEEFLFGILYFFFYKAVNRKTFEEMHFSIRSVGRWLRQPKIWLWVFLPAAINLLQTFVAWLVSPSFYSATIQDELTRISPLIPGNMTSDFFILIPYLLILAMGEEICFRAFFQDRLSMYLPVSLSILLSSLVFTLGHVCREPMGIAAFWVLTLVFGMIQKKTKNAYISTIAHFVSNYLAFVLIYILK